MDECIRCGTPLREQKLCRDVTCGFSEHEQSCVAGWEGHPEKDPNKDVLARCSCEEERSMIHDSYDNMEMNDLWQRVFHPLPDSDEAGKIKLVDMMPRIIPKGQTADFAIPQMARVSYGKGTKKVSEDSGLIKYLMRHKHDSPFEAIVFKFLIRCPIFVYRQWFRHRSTDQCEMEIISTDENARKYMSMNEYSARYSVVPDVYYIPKDLRIQSKTNKQGGDEFLPEELNEIFGSASTSHMQDIRKLYEDMLNRGVARELARAVLPVCYVTEFYMVTNLLNLMRWMYLRLDPHAQLEIRVYAEYIASIVKRLCPVTFRAFELYQLNAVTFTLPELILIQGEMDHPVLDIDLTMVDAARESMSNRELSEFEAKKKGRKIIVPDFVDLKSSIPSETFE